MRKIAKYVGLVDVPDQRKTHSGRVPIAGGIAICVVLANILYTRPYLIPHNDLLLCSILALTVVGTVDDKYALNVRCRLFVQFVLSLAFILLTGFKVHYLGNLFGFGEIELGWFVGGVLSVVAIVGAINAFNMIDGLDGLLGCVSIVTFAGLGVLLSAYDQYGLAYLCWVMVVTIVPYVCMNLGYFGRKRKVFMGDAGSMMIGFIAVWVLLSASQGVVAKPISPVVALWLIAVPLMDMTATIIRRLCCGRSPFRSDKDHIHYILQDLGLSSQKTLFLISSLACMFALLGVLGELLDYSAATMFYGFFGCFLGYFLLLLRLKRAVVV
jgi:UDP-GlcNAc:undecaprenyl-phosphate GlcNAc-1-phosphate transferase